ncbi:MAG: Flp pilus assembly protein CpaB [Pseudomonadota bacterium]
MKNPRAFIFALLVALLATLMQCRYVASREKDLLYRSEPQKVLVATRDILPNVRMDETMVELREVPRDWVQPKAVASVDDAAGQITAVPIFKGEQVLSTKLVDADDAGLAFFVPKGMRAVSVAVDVYNAVGGHIKPGNHVDILGTFDFGEGEHSDLRTITLMQDVWVLAVVDDIGKPTTRDVVKMPPEGEEAEKPPEAPPGPSETVGSGATISVAVSPADAQKLVMAQELGRLHVSLRSLWEGEGGQTLDHATVANTLGIVQPVRSKTRPAYRMMSGGGDY